MHWAVVSQKPNFKVLRIFKQSKWFDKKTTTKSHFDFENSIILQEKTPWKELEVSLKLFGVFLSHFNLEKPEKPLKSCLVIPRARAFH